MKIAVAIPVDDLGELREAMLDRLEDVRAREEAAIGYPGERIWRAKREACERIVEAIPGTGRPAGA